MGKEKFYVTTPIYYPNDIPHIGHAYTTVIADVLARWNKCLGKDVYFLTGTDDHGKKIAEAAEKCGKTPKQFVDDLIPKFKSAWEKLGINYDRFIRTTDKDHEATVQEMLQRAFDKGDIYKGEYEGLYCVGCEQYYTEKDLVNGCCPIHKKPVEKVKEETYFFKLTEYKEKLLKFYEDNPDFISPKKRRMEIINRVKELDRDLSISRTSFDWGIPLLFDKKHVCYVWFDALFNYYTAVKDKLEFWPADVNIIGKDIIWFHTVYWPAFLMSVGLEIPKKVFAHGFWTFNSQKISKSVGKVINVDELIAITGNKDSIRYFLCRGVPFGEDGDFSEQAVVDRHNGELLNKLGNLVSRVTGLIEKNGMEKCESNLYSNKDCEGFTSEDHKKILEGIMNGAEVVFQPNGKLKEGSEVENELYKNNDLYVIRINNKDYKFPKVQGRCAFSKYNFYGLLNLMQNYEIDRALNDIFRFIDRCNEYVQNKKPWETKDKRVLYELADAIKKISILLFPFMPETCKKISEKFGGYEFTFDELRKPLKADAKIIKGKNLFSKIEYKSSKVGGKSNKGKKTEGVMTMDEVTFEDFAKLDLRVAQIKNIENIEGADKLYKISLDVGEEIGARTVCAGIKEYYPNKEDLIGRKVVYFSNLKPRKMRGVVSEGMLFAAFTKNNSIVNLLNPGEIPNGSQVS